MTMGIVQHKWQDQKNQLHVTSTHCAVSFAFVTVNVQQCPSAMLGERKHEGDFFVETLSRDKSIHCTGHVVHPLLNPAACQSFAANFNLKGDTLCYGCTYCERNHTLVQAVQSIKKHLLVAVLIDDSRQGIEDQMDPSSFTSCQIISCLTAQPFTFSLVVTPHVLLIFCSDLNHLSESGYALFSWPASIWNQPVTGWTKAMVTVTRVTQHFVTFRLIIDMGCSNNVSLNF